MCAAPIEEKVRGLFDRPGFLVGTTAGQCIEHIRDRTDATLDRDSLALQTSGVARAIPLFVVAAGDGGREVEQR